MRYHPAMGSRKLFIFTAVHAESKAIARALRNRGMNSSVEIRVIGIRAKHLQADMTSSTTRGIIMAGFAGALEASLRIGDVVVAGLPSHFVIDGGFREGLIHTSADMAATPAKKLELFAMTGALAVDMEGERVRPFADSLGVPFLHIRAISDTATDALDPAVLDFIDDRGRVRPFALTWGLVRRPGLILKLARLGLNARVAGKRLGEVVAKLMGSDLFGG